MKVLIFLLIIGISNAATVTPFSSPENSLDAVLSFIENSDNILIASYTFSSDEIAEKLVGKNATVIVEKSPVGGIDDRVICWMVNNDIDVFLYDGPLNFMHAKYMISGNKSLITSENFGKNGFPINDGNIGWGAIIEDDKTSEELEKVFYEDLSHSEKFECQGGDINPINVEIEELESYENQNVLLVKAPGATNYIIKLIESADHRLLVQQFYIYRFLDNKKSENPLLEAVVQASDKLPVRVILDGTWYNVDKDNIKSNYYTNRYFQILKNNGKNIDSRIYEDRKIHNKGFVVDNTVFISSINWNRNSPENNREIGIVITGNSVEYFVSMFEKYWESEDNLIIIIGFIILIFIAYKILHRFIF